MLETLLHTKRVELKQAKLRHEALQHDVAALERTSAMPLPPALRAQAPAPQPAKLTKKQKHAQRKKQVLELFYRCGGRLDLQTLMQELRLSRNAIKEWMNACIDMAPETTPWMRQDGNKSRFILKEALSPELSPTETGAANRDGQDTRTTPEGDPTLAPVHAPLARSEHDRTINRRSPWTGWRDWRDQQRP